MNRIIQGDCLQTLKTLPDQSVHCCVTGPPYFGLRDYGHEEQIGLELTIQGYLDRTVEVFEEVRRVLRDDGTLWLNISDSYAAERGGTHQPAETLAGGVGGYMGDGSRVNRGRFDGYNPTRDAKAIGLKHKDMCLIPQRLSIALQENGWYFRSTIIWNKPNHKPESVRDRPTMAHEYILLLSKSERYYYDSKAVMELGADGNLRNLRSIWGISNNKQDKKLPEDKDYVKHPAPYPPELVYPCILAGCPEGGVVLDPFMGSGSTAIAAVLNQRKYLGCELNPDYVALANKRIKNECGLLALFAE